MIGTKRNKLVKISFKGHKNDKLLVSRNKDNKSKIFLSQTYIVQIRILLSFLLRKIVLKVTINDDNE